ncbi:MAG: FAD-dependent oxidoreductase [Kiritimatiellae bacterium]|nr:FAD-dependent oxidoreductase [Kiritimatiellia bacterium]
MTGRLLRSTVVEPAKERPVLFDADVVVAGCGLCGTFAAIASGRCGARTLVIDRFGTLGGNMGPAMVVNGSLFGEADATLPGGLAGIPAEFKARYEALGGSAARDPARSIYPEDAAIASHLAYVMMNEAGVEILLSAYAADPIMDGNTVCGLFAECASGRVAARAKVTVDGTGDAGIAARAGAPIVPYMAQDDTYAVMMPRASMKRGYPTYYNDTQLLFLIANVAEDGMQAFWREDVDLSAEDEEWAATSLKAYPKALVPILRQAWSTGEYRRRIDDVADVKISASCPGKLQEFGPGIVGFRVSAVGAIDAADPLQMSRLEAAMREQGFRTVAFFRKHAPGFENAYLIASSSFLGMRGGPHIEGDHTLSMEDRFAGRKCDDVLFRNTHLGSPGHGGDPSGFDVPYAVCLPRGVEGLLVCGRGAAYRRRGHDPCAMRARPAMMVFGQAVGTAAAIAALDGVAPREVDIRKVQQRLVADGICLGERSRLAELGLGR